MTLTQQNYFTKDNNYLSNSKIGDWLLCKKYFYLKNIKHEIEFEKTDSMTIGSAVDSILTDIKNVTSGNWVVREFNGTTKEGKEETLRLKEEGKTILTQKKYDDIMGMSIAVSETSAYKDLKDHISQDILQFKMPINQYFEGLCGIPDWYFIDKDGVCTITDLKTSRVTNLDKYYYHCREFGYFRQQATYRILLKALHPEIKSFKSRHLVVGKVRNIWEVISVYLDEKEIEKEMENISRIIKDICEETEFKKKDAVWDESIIIKNPHIDWIADSDWDDEE